MIELLTAARSPGTGPGESSSAARIRRAAREFEAQLLSALLAPLEKGFATVPGEPSAAGSQQYGYLGLQALAAALSNSGGLGIADLLVRRLEDTKGRGAVASAKAGE